MMISLPCGTPFLHLFSRVSNLHFMTPLRSAAVHVMLVLLVLFSPQLLLAAAPKVHTVALGGVRRVPYTQPDATADSRSDETSTLKIRPLLGAGPPVGGLLVGRTMARPPMVVVTMTAASRSAALSV